PTACSRCAACRRRCATCSTSPASPACSTSTTAVPRRSRRSPERAIPRRTVTPINRTHAEDVMSAQNGTEAASSNGSRRWYQSISAKLQIAFGLIAALTIGASVVAILRFADVNVVISRLIDLSLPTVKLSLALENKAAAIASAADDLASAIDEGERK